MFHFQAKYQYWLMLTAFFGLFILLMLWHTVLAPSTRFPVALLLLLNVTPLLIPLRGMLHANRKSCGWIAYISLFYIVQGITECYANDAERDYAALEIFFSFQLFLGAACYVRTVSINNQTPHA